MNSGSDIPLDKPEQFLYDLSEISNFAERISCFMFQAEFDDSITTIEHTLNNIRSTCDVNSATIKNKNLCKKEFNFSFLWKINLLKNY